MRTYLYIFEDGNIYQGNKTPIAADLEACDNHLLQIACVEELSNGLQLATNYINGEWAEIQMLDLTV